MALNEDKGLFWNSLGGDRLYDAESMGKWLSKFFTSGVFAGDCAVTPGTGLSVNVAPGYVNIANPDAANPGGKVVIFDTSTNLTLELADGSKNRIDTVVVERNDNDREITLKIVKGTAATTPSATAPVRTAAIYQIVLAEIYIGAGATSISSSNITDKRNDPFVCGVITGTLNNFSYGTEALLSGVDALATGTFYFQYQ